LLNEDALTSSAQATVSAPAACQTCTVSCLEGTRGQLLFFCDSFLLRQPGFEYVNESKKITGREINVTNKQSATSPTNKKLICTRLLQTLPPSTSQPPLRQLPNHLLLLHQLLVSQLFVVRIVTISMWCTQNAGHNKLYKLFTSVAITNDSTSTAKTLIDCEATIDFVSRDTRSLQALQARSLLSHFPMVHNKDPNCKVLP
jgi:hypothetical protein